MEHACHSDIEEDPIAAGPATGEFASGLWHDARWWLHQIFTVFGDARAIAKGLERKLGLHLAAWLFAIEGTVRRLILAAAHAMGLAPITGTPRTSSARKTPAPRVKRPASFRVFALHRAGAQRPSTPSSVTDFHGSLYRHLALPCDPLLAVGKPEPQLRQPASPRRASTGARIVHERLSRFDPYRIWPVHDDSHAAYLRRLAERERRKARVRLPPADLARAMVFISAERARAQAKREQSRIIPAPGLAARIDALARLMLDPQAIIIRTARRLARHQGLALRLAAQPRAEIRLPKSEKRRLGGQEMLAAATRSVWPPRLLDSS